MKKISSKIVVGLFLALILWSGVGMFGVNKVEAELISNGPLKPIPVVSSWSGSDIGPMSDYCGSVPSTGATPSQIASWKDCSSKYLAAAGHSSALAGFWDKFLGGVAKTLDLGAGIMNGENFLAMAAFMALWAGVESLFLAISAGILNGMLAITIQSFSVIVSNSGIEIAWGVMRNLINISFIFILLYISISTIIGTIGPKAKSTIAQVVIAAILVNFSLFFTKILIDASNIVAVNLYSYTGQCAPSGSGCLSSFGTLLMNGLGIQSLWSLKNFTTSGQTTTLFLLLLQIILMTSLMWSYLKMSFMLLGRMVMLLILMSLSPIAFLGGAIPGLGDKASEWWKAFTGQLIMAPAFMFILIIVSELLKKQAEINNLTAGFFGAEGPYGVGLNVGPFIYYIIVIAILSVGVKMIKKLSGSVGEIMEKVGKGVKFLASATLALGASVATGGVAAGPAMAFLEKTAVSGAGRISGTLARSGMRAMKKGEKVGDIFRDAGLTGTVARAAKDGLLGEVKKQTGLDLKKGYGYIQDIPKDMTKYGGIMANRIGPVEDQKQLKILEDIDKNIKKQAQERAKDLHRGEMEAINNDTTLSAGEKAAKRSELQIKIDLDAKNLEPSIMVDEMGINPDEHKKEKEDLRVNIKQKTIDRNKYLADLARKGYFGKKSAQELMSKVKYEEKSAKDKAWEAMKKEIKDEEKDSGESEPTGGAEKKAGGKENAEDKDA